MATAAASTEEEEEEKRPAPAAAVGPRDLRGGRGAVAEEVAEAEEWLI